MSGWFSLVSSPRVQEGNGQEKMILVAVEAVPAGSKPPAAVCVSISTGEGHGFGAAAPLSIMASSLHRGGAGGPVESSPKLVRHISSGSTFFVEQLSPCLAFDLLQRPPRACEFWCMLVRLHPWQNVTAEHLASGLLNGLVALIFSGSLSNFLFKLSIFSSTIRYRSAIVG